MLLNFVNYISIYMITYDVMIANVKLPTKSPCFDTEIFKYTKLRTFRAFSITIRNNT